MKNKNFRYLITVISFLTLGYMFSGGDCGTDTEDTPPPVTTISAPSNVSVSLSQASGSFATVKWNHSADQSRSDFAGYTVITYEVDTANNILSTFRTDNVPKTSNSQVVNSIVPLKRYRSYVTARLNSNVKSDSVGTKVYAAVFENNGVIDEYQATGSAQSGFGWETMFGIGTQYAFTAQYSGSIDLHMRSNGGVLRFYSPDEYLNPGKVTRFELVGQGQAAFDLTDLSEPASTSIAVIQDNVYLLKLQSGNYVKVWIKQISTVSGFQRVNFTYKVQPIAGLRVLKR